MEYLKQRQKTRSRLYSKVTIFALLVLLALFIRPTWKILEKSRESRHNLKKAETELVELEVRKKQLASDVAYLKTDHGLDQEIRNKFGVAKDGETMVVIVRGEGDKKPPAPATPPLGFFRRIFGPLWSGFLETVGLD